MTAAASSTNTWLLAGVVLLGFGLLSSVTVAQRAGERAVLREEGATAKVRVVERGPRPHERRSGRLTVELPTPERHVVHLSVGFDTWEALEPGSSLVVRYAASRPELTVPDRDFRRADAHTPTDIAFSAGLCGGGLLALAVAWWRRRAW